MSYPAGLIDDAELTKLIESEEHGRDMTVRLFLENDFRTPTSGSFLQREQAGKSAEVSRISSLTEQMEDILEPQAGKSLKLKAGDGDRPRDVQLSTSRLGEWRCLL